MDILVSFLFFRIYPPSQSFEMLVYCLSVIEIMLFCGMANVPAAVIDAFGLLHIR